MSATEGTIKERLETTIRNLSRGGYGAALQRDALAEIERLQAEVAAYKRLEGHVLASTRALELRLAAALALPAPAQAEPVSPVEADVEEEAVAFEQWAHGRHYDMGQHPLHYLFLDSKTYAARDGWRAALAWIKSKLAAPPPPAGEAG